MAVNKINSNCSSVEYSDGDKVEHQEIVLRIAKDELVRCKSTLHQIKECIEKLFILGKINPKSKTYINNKHFMDECKYDGRIKIINMSCIDILDIDKINDELNLLYKRNSNKNIFIQNRVPWESREQTFIDLYRRIGVSIKPKNVRPIEVRNGKPKT